MKTRITTAIIAVLVSTLAVGVAAPSSISFNYGAKAQQTVATQVLVGGGNNTHPFFGYSPQQVQIKAGGRVVWSAPSNAPPEPHTVTFVFNNKTMAGPDVPFAVTRSTKFMPLPPGVNSKPNIVPGGQNGMNTVIVSNAMAYDPALIDSTGNAKTCSPNGNLIITGNEQYVNSAWLVPKGENKYFHTLHTHLLQHFKSLELIAIHVHCIRGCQERL